MPKQPNIILVICDQLRGSALGCAGVEGVNTPHLDAFAAEGVRFSNAVSNTPACTPARACLLTGKHVMSHGLINNDMQLGHHHDALAKVLTRNGYNCSYIGKWHLDGVNRAAYIPPGPRRQGFDDLWGGVECNHSYFDGYYYDDETQEPVWWEGYEPDGQTDLAINYLKQQSGSDNPFMLMLSWGPPHCPYPVVSSEYLDQYPPAEIDLLPNAIEANVQAPETIGRASKPAVLSEDECTAWKQQVVAQYYAHVTALDHCFGRLIDALESQGLKEDTIVVFTSDHGDMLFSQDRGWKSKPWRESVGIPLLIRWPEKIASEWETRTPVGLVDLMPTLLELTGTPVPAEAEGTSFSPFLLGQECDLPESAYINFPCMPTWFQDPEWRGVVTEQYTYVAKREGAWLLYDDISDPFQMDNLVGKEGYKDEQIRLDGLVQQWLAETGDEFLTSTQIADLLCPGHVDNVLVGKPLEPRIQKEMQARAQRRLALAQS